MNTIWSTYIQSIGTLYLSRLLRFSDMFKEKYMDAFDIEDGKNVLEIGCGPGALSQSLKRWYPNSNITGIDRDSNFIRFAKEQAPYLDFLEDDAVNLSFDNNTFDVSISNTVAEHIEPSAFFSGQYRVLKPGGVCLVLSSRRGVNIQAPCIREQNEFEKDIWQRVEERCRDTDKKYNVCAYSMDESEYPRCMEKFRFRNVSTEYITVNLTPDNPIYSKEDAYKMINANRQTALDGIEFLKTIASDIVSSDEIEELTRLTNDKYRQRIELYDAGIKQWDTDVSVIMIMRGIK